MNALPHPTLLDKFWISTFTRRARVPSLDAADTSKLRLILGVGRSGTTWLSNALALATPPMRFFHEPLYHLRPKLWLHFTRDVTATVPAPPRRFFAAYQFFCAPRAEWKAVIRRPQPQRDDPNFELCLVKEVHSLLGTEALVKVFRAPAIALLRDPLYSVDSIFDAHGLPSPYFHHEEKLVRTPEFLHAHLPAFAERVTAIVAELQTKPHRLRTILEKTLAVELMEQWFRAVAKREPLLKVMHYEELCTDPLAGFRDAAQFLGLPWDAKLAGTVEGTTRANETSGHRHSIYRDTAAQVKRKWRFLTDAEAEEGRGLLEKLRA